MQIRAITTEEIETFCAIQAQSFNFKLDRKQLREDIAQGRRTPETMRACFDDRGRMTAVLVLLPYDVWFDGRPAAMGGIGGVASMPASRRSGNVRALMAGVLEEMNEGGDTFSFLYPFSHGYYRKFGYEVFRLTHEARLPLDDLLQLREPGRVEQFLPEMDPEPIVDVYNAFASRYNMMVDRDGRNWRGRLDQDPAVTARYTYLWYDEADEPGAYVQCTPESGDLKVLDIAWTSPRGLRGILSFASRYAGPCKELVLPAVPPQTRLEMLVPEPYHITIKGSYTGMNRVVSVERALGALAAPEGAGAVALRVSDPTAPWNEGVWRVQWEGGQVRVTRAAGDADISLNACALSPLITGALTAGELAQRADVELSGGVDGLNRLFPPRRNHIADFF